MIEKKKNTLNVVFSSDDNYAQHLGVAIYSLLENNRKFPHIRIYVIDNEISEINKEKILAILDTFSNSTISWISFKAWGKKLALNMSWDISISSYARIFIASMLPLDIERILYMDCDMIVCDKLDKFWNIDLEGCVLGAVQDTINDSTKAAVGKGASQQYFNAGLLLIDLKEWRNKDIEAKCLEFIDAHAGCVAHHDQGILNGVLKEDWQRLPIRYNLMTIHFIFDMRKIKKYFRDQASFYSEKEIVEAKRTPAILHFTPSFTSRPWVKGCNHPLKKMYWDNLKNTPWKDAKQQKNYSKWYVRLIDWRYRNLPY